MANPVSFYANMVVQVRRWLTEPNSDEKKTESTAQVEKIRKKDKNPKSARVSGRSSHRHGGRPADSSLPHHGASAPANRPAASTHRASASTNRTRSISRAERVSRAEADAQTSTDSRPSSAPSMVNDSTVFLRLPPEKNITITTTTTVESGPSIESLHLAKECASTSTLFGIPSTSSTAQRTKPFSSVTKRSTVVSSHIEDTQMRTQKPNHRHVSQENLSIATKPSNENVKKLDFPIEWSVSENHGIKSSSIAMKKITDSLMSTWTAVSSVMSEPERYNTSSKVTPVRNTLYDIHIGHSCKRSSSNFAIAAPNSSEFRKVDFSTSRDSIDGPIETSEEVLSTMDRNSFESMRSSFSMSESNRLWEQARRNWATTLSRAQSTDCSEAEGKLDLKKNLKEVHPLKRNSSTIVLNEKIHSLPESYTQVDDTTNFTTSFSEDSENLSLCPKLSDVCPLFSSLQKNENHLQRDNSRIKEMEAIIRNCLTQTSESGPKIHSINTSNCFYRAIPSCVEQNEQTNSFKCSKTCYKEDIPQHAMPTQEKYFNISNSVVCIPSNSCMNHRNEKESNISSNNALKCLHRVTPLRLKQVDLFNPTICSKTHSNDGCIHEDVTQLREEYSNSCNSLASDSLTSFKSNDTSSSSDISQGTESVLKLCRHNGYWSCPVLSIKRCTYSLSLLEEKETSERFVQPTAFENDLEHNCLADKTKTNNYDSQDSSVMNSIFRNFVVRRNNKENTQDSIISFSNDGKIAMNSNEKKEARRVAGAMETATARLVVAALEAAGAEGRPSLPPSPPLPPPPLSVPCMTRTIEEWTSKLTRLRAGGGSECGASLCVPCATCGACAICGACMTCGSVRRNCK